MTLVNTRAAFEKAVTDKVSDVDPTILMVYDNVHFTSPGKTKKYIIMSLDFEQSTLQNQGAASDYYSGVIQCNVYVPKSKGTSILSSVCNALKPNPTKAAVAAVAANAKLLIPVDATLKLPDARLLPSLANVLSVFLICFCRFLRLAVACLVLMSTEYVKSAILYSFYNLFNQLVQILCSWSTHTMSCLF